MIGRMILVLALALGGAWVAPVLVAGPAMAQRTVTRSERTVEVRGEFYYIHQVKKKETLYAIARAYGADIEAIRRVNGLQTDQLKKKQRLLIPAVRVEQPMRKEPVVQEPVVEQPALQPFEKEPVMARQLRPFEQYGTLQIALMLPTLSAGTEQERALAQDFADFYRGTLLGLEALKREGISTKLQLINSGASADKVSSEIRRGKLKDANLIIGPVYPEAFVPAAAYAAAQGIAIVSPLQGVGEQANPFVFEAAPPRELMYDKLFRLFGPDRLMGADSVLRTRNTLIIRHKQKADSAVLKLVEGAFVGRVGNVHTLDYAPLQGDKTLSDEIDNQLITLLDEKAENVIFVPISAEPAVEEALSRLSSLLIKEHDRFRITVVGTSQWWQFDNLNLELYFRLNVHYPTSYHADRTDPAVAEFFRAYIEAFGSVPTQFSMRGYDVVKYFGSALGRFGVDMPASVAITNNGGYHPQLLQVQYLYMNGGAAGGKYRNLNWPVVHFRPGYTIRVK